MSHIPSMSQPHNQKLSKLQDSQEHVYRVRMEPERTGWARISDLLRQNDQMVVQDIKEDIDTLLVFAGLFSAVLTAFVIETYHDLKQQPDDSSNAILLQISLQLSSLSVSGNHVNSTAPPFSSAPFNSAPSSVRINSLWSLSLAISLITASLGMLVKQWLREFLSQNTQNPKEQVKIHTYRHAGIKGWRVFELAAFLPLLLQLALLLFFIGLSEFLRELDPIVGWVTTGMVLLWLVVFLFTTSAPLIFPSCPYKTPVLRPFFSAVRKAFVFLMSKACRCLIMYVDLTVSPPTIIHRVWLQLAGWIDRTQQSEEIGACRQRSDLAILVYSVDHLRGERLGDTLIQCSRNYTEDEARLCVQFMAHQLRRPQTARISSPPSGYDLIVSQVCVNMLNTEDGLFWVLMTGRNFLPTFQALHECITSAASYTWEHSDIEVSRSAFRRLTLHSSDTAALALLSVFRTIRSRIVRPTGVWDPQSFHWACHSQNDRVAGGIITNLVDATRAILCVLWDEPTDVHEPIHDCIDQARFLHPSDLEADAIVLISAFAAFCWLANPADKQLHIGVLNETLEELANTLDRQNLENINDMHAHCLRNACRILDTLGLANARILDRMREIVDAHPLSVVQLQHS